jgi:hypothetical protein
MGKENYLTPFLKGALPLLDLPKIKSFNVYADDCNLAMDQLALNKTVRCTENIHALVACLDPYSPSCKCLEGDTTMNMQGKSQAKSAVPEPANGPYKMLLYILMSIFVVGGYIVSKWVNNNYEYGDIPTGDAWAAEAEPLQPKQ